jgi:hypothetical protein
MILCNCGERLKNSLVSDFFKSEKFYYEISTLKIFLKIEIYKIDRKINSWSKLEDKSPMKIMSKMELKL